jgi:DNA-directed RNA polymerase specialized sigma24 family protein
MERLHLFEHERDRVSRIAARILGSESDADDVLQEALLRLSRSEDIDDLPAWLTTFVTRLCLDHPRKRANRSTFEAAAGPVESILDSLAPAERVALALHDVFGYAFDEIGVVLGRSVTAVRQLASRARRKTQGLSDDLNL